MAISRESGSSREFEGEVVSIDPIMGDAFLLSISAPPALVQRLEPGQFFNILCRGASSFDPLLRRPYSVYRVDHEQPSLTFLVRPFGRGSGWLAQRAPGDHIGLLGPLGNAFTVTPRTRRALMVAGGVGVAPLVMLSDLAVDRGIDVVFIMGAADESGLLESSELAGSIEFVVATDDGSRGHRGLAPELTADYVSWADQIFACGPEPMYRTLRAVVDPLRNNRKPSVQISVERGMACGLGACLGCVVETRRGMIASCVQGPVFDLDEVVL